jgi:hypothetical protein
MPSRRFPPPWTVGEYRGISYIIRDANNFAVPYVYFESEPGRRVAAKLMTKDEAMRVQYNACVGFLFAGCWQADDAGLLIVQLR